MVERVPLRLVCDRHGGLQSQTIRSETSQGGNAVSIEVNVKASNKFSWERAVAESDLAATSKLVAFTLGLYFSKAGDSCWPSMDTLARASGLDRSTVVRHVGLLRRTGWLKVESGGSKLGGERITNRYETAIPVGKLPFDTGRREAPVAENGQSPETDDQSSSTPTTGRPGPPKQAVTTNEQDDQILTMDANRDQTRKIKAGRR